MKKNLWICSMVVMVLFFINNIEIHAAVTNDDEKFEYNIEEKVDVTYEEIEEAILDVVEKEDEIKTEERMENISFNIADYNLDKGYTEYLISDTPIASYNAGIEFKKMLSEEYRIKIPYLTEDGESAVLIYNEDTSGNLILQEKTIIYDNEHLFVEPETVEQIIQEQVEDEVINLTCCYSERYYMTLIYVETTSNEYLIPFSKQKIINVENGKLYTVKDFFSNMEKTFDETQIIDSKENGGVPYRDYPVERYIVLLGISCVGIVATGILLAKLRKKV